MKFDQSITLPELDPTRSHLEILKDVLDLLEDNQPVYEVSRMSCLTGDLDCRECGFPLTGNVKYDLRHATYKNNKYARPCRYIRAIAELRAFIQVENELE